MQIGTVTAGNSTKFTRERGIRTAIPVIPGTLYDQKIGLLRVDNRAFPAQLDPVGARHSDGSARAAIVSGIVQVHPWETAVLEVHDDTEIDVPEFEFPSLGTYHLHPYVNGELVGFPGMDVVEDRSGKIAVETVRYGRIDPAHPLWFEWRQVYFARSPISLFRLWWGCSNPQNTPWNFPLGPRGIEIIPTGAVLYIDSHSQKVEQEGPPLQIEYGMMGGFQSNQLSATCVHLQDALEKANDPVVVSTVAAEATHMPLYFAGGHWAGNPDSASIHGVVQEEPPAAAETAASAAAIWGSSAVAKQNERSQTGWRRNHQGCKPEAGGTGAQPDFGALHFPEFVHSSHPVVPNVIRADVAQEACRSQWYAAIDGSPHSETDHPELHVWSGKPNVRIAGDHFGTQGPEPWNYERREGTDWVYQEVWKGLDREHMSMVAHLQAAWMTGDPLLLAQADRFCNTWLSSMRNVEPNVWTRAPRDFGRTLQTGLWLWWVTGRDDMRTRISDRVKQWMNDCVEGDDLLVTQVAYPHPTNIANEDWFIPWQETFVQQALQAYVRHLVHDLDSATRAEFERMRLKHAESIMRGGVGVYGSTRAEALVELPEYEEPVRFHGASCPDMHEPEGAPTMVPTERGVLLAQPIRTSMLEAVPWWVTGKAIAWNDGRFMDPHEYEHSGEQGRANLYHGYNLWFWPMGQVCESIAADQRAKVKAEQFNLQRRAERNSALWRDGLEKWACVVPGALQY